MQTCLMLPSEYRDHDTCAKGSGQVGIPQAITTCGWNFSVTILISFELCLMPEGISRELVREIRLEPWIHAVLGI